MASATPAWSTSTWTGRRWAGSRRRSPASRRRSSGRSAPDRLGRVGVLLVLAEQAPYGHLQREDEALHRRRDLVHAELAPEPARKVGGVKRVGPLPPVLPLRV